MAVQDCSAMLLRACALLRAVGYIIKIQQALSSLSRHVGERLGDSGSLRI
jgi:hypothetical protein